MSAFEPYPRAAAESETAPPPDDLLASRWRRFWALLIDLLVVGFILLLVAMAATGGEIVTEDRRLDLGNESLIGAAASALAALLYYGPLLSRRGARNGQTLGKQLLDVRVVTAEGVPVTYLRALRRELLGVSVLQTLTFGLYIFVDYPWALYDPRRQTLHDKIGATYVIRADAPFAGWQPPPSAGPPPPEPPPGPPSPPSPRSRPLPHEAPKGDWRPPSAGDDFDDARRAFGG